MQKLTFCLLMILFMSCTKQYVETSDVIFDLSLTPDATDADGTSSIAVKVKLNTDADATKRKIVLETTAGSFSGANSKTTTVDATFENGELIAKADITVPLSAGWIVVTAKPEIKDRYNDFITKDSVYANASAPYKITAETSAFGVSTDFIGEVLITGKLTNSNGKKVSLKNQVKFEDYINGIRHSGRFRALQSLSDENSSVSAYYSPGHVLPGTDIEMILKVLDPAGQETNIRDTIFLTVIP